MKINLSNVSKIESVLAQINGSSVAHTATRGRLLIITSQIENQLEKLGIAKHDRAGAKIEFISGEPTPNRYKWSRIATKCTLIRGTKNWFLILCKRCEIWKAGGKTELLLTPSQDILAVSNLRQGYTIDK